ncbi:MAG: hypothetical protein KJ674_04900 [Nanoarchaeota archaeon]|nr:hypothetical protein [Nanoarchaeota archaeon]
MSHRENNVDFVNLLVKKSKTKEKTKADSISLLGPGKKDEEIKPYLMDKDDESIKKIEDITKKIKEKIK